MIACKICMFSKGLTLQSPHIFQTDDELQEHLEAVHHMFVKREGETAKEAEARVRRAHPEIDTCPECVEARSAKA